MNYPTDVFFDIETLLNIAQPRSILVLSDSDCGFLEQFIEQKALINQQCQVTQVSSKEAASLDKLEQRFDVGIVFDFLEHLSKPQGAQTLSKLRDLLTAQYCICLPLVKSGDESRWQLTDLFGFALDRVASYQQGALEYGLFKYNINDYKKTPEWLNSDNWANPNMWGKYWW